MKTSKKEQISQIVSVFHGRAAPENGASLVGYSALIEAFRLEVPLPERLAVISSKHRRYEAGECAVYTPRHMPDDTIAGHLTFAFRYEGVELGVLRALFLQTGGGEI